MTNSALVRGEVKFGGAIFWTGFSRSLALVNFYIRSTCVIYRRALHAGPSVPLCFARIKLQKMQSLVKRPRLISVVDVVGPMNPYQPIPFHILSFAVFQSRILIYLSSTDKIAEEKKVFERNMDI